MFAQIYIGCRCGETWKVSRCKIIDPERDDVWEELICDVCNQPVTKEKKVNGKPCLHALSDEEIEAAWWGEWWGAADDDLFDD